MTQKRSDMKPHACLRWYIYIARSQQIIMTSPEETLGEQEYPCNTGSSEEYKLSVATSSDKWNSRLRNFPCNHPSQLKLRNF
jgi:hypothetical protein